MLRKPLFKLGSFQVEVWHVLVLLGAIMSSAGTVVVLKQNGPWGKFKIGNTTLAGAGCLITVFTIAVNALTGRTLTPDQTATLLAQKGGISSSGAATLDKVTKELGVKIVNRIDHASPREIGEVVDQALANNSYAIVHVDKDGNETGDHFVVITERTASGYKAADPAPGKFITLDQNFRGQSNWGNQGIKTYAGVGVRAVVRA